MSESHPWLIKSRRHAQTTHVRWMQRRSHESEYSNEWKYEQCGRCQYFFPIMGALSDDWGACTNLKSPFDGRVMLEHDGCGEFSEADQGWQSFEDAPEVP